MDNEMQLFKVFKITLTIILSTMLRNSCLLTINTILNLLYYTDMRLHISTNCVVFLGPFMYVRHKISNYNCHISYGFRLRCQYLVLYKAR